MNTKQLEQMKNGQGFIAALDQSGGSTPKALASYGIGKDRYANESEMFDLVHTMRTRIITNPAFSSQHILAAILFEQTIDRKIENLYTADYLWDKKGIIPFVKVDKGLAEQENGVQLMKDMPGLDALLKRAKIRNIFGTKMRSVIHEANEKGIEDIVKQQFVIGTNILNADLMPILEPEVSIKAPGKAICETILKRELLKGLDALPGDQKVMFKLTIPSVPNFYKDLIEHPKVIRVVALSGGYSRKEANALLKENTGLIASFSRALSEGLSEGRSDSVFKLVLEDSVDSIYRASIS